MDAQELPQTEETSCGLAAAEGLAGQGYGSHFDRGLRGDVASTQVQTEEAACGPPAGVCHGAQHSHGLVDAVEQTQDKETACGPPAGVCHRV